MDSYFKTQLIAAAIDLAKESAAGGEKISNVFLSKYPEFLYKYRPCEDRAFSLITEEYLWAANPDKFDDPLDSIVAISSEEELGKIVTWMKNHLGEFAFFLTPPIGMAKEKCGLGLPEYIQGAKEFSAFCKQKDKETALNEYLESMTAGLSQEDRIKVIEIFARIQSPEVEQQMAAEFERAVLPVANALRQSIFVGCLTTAKDNHKMWEDYGDKYTGFVIEYDMHSCMKDPILAQTLRSTFPVKYENKGPAAFSLDIVQCWYALVFHGVPFSNIAWQASLLEHALYKKEEYRAEKEWRIISSQKRIPAPPISAIYAGFKINQEKENRLKAICAEKNIPLFKQEINQISRKMIFAKIDEGDTP